ncbi:MAG: amylo-alpha-1,6-glucosidase [Pseudomonadota bacterium]
MMPRSARRYATVRVQLASWLIAGACMAGSLVSASEPESLPDELGVQARSDVPVAGMLADMKLQLPEAVPRRVVFTDRVDGFFEAQTGRAGLGQYRVADDVLIAGLEIAVDGDIQSREKVQQAPLLLPNQLLSHFDRISEHVLLLQGQRTFAGIWQSERPARLSARFHLPPNAELDAGALNAAKRNVAESGIHVASDTAGQVIEPSGSGLWLLPLRFGTSRWYLALRAPIDATVQLIPLLDKGGPKLLQISTPASAATLAVSLSYARNEAEAQRAALTQAPALLPQILQQRLAQQFARSRLISPNANYNRALVWASFSAQSLVVEEFGKGIWAGLPWFRDNWGRDTFIALPGTLLVTGQFTEAKAVLDNFIRWQRRTDISDPEYGRVPNRVSASDATIYNTVDGTPWLIRELLEYLRYTGDLGYGLQQLPLIDAYVRGVERHWLDDKGLLTHDDADTWMDARIDGLAAWSARGNRAVEIQALWFTALTVAAELTALNGDAKAAQHYRERAEQVRQAFLQAFWNGRQMADRLQADGSADYRLRPNQLMLISIPFAPFVPEAIEADVLRQTVSGLLFPYGIASLDPRDPAFHPRHENPPFHHKDAAYHNGTVWGWNAGFTVTALNKFGYQDLAWQLSQNLAEQILYGETPGTMSELLDALPDQNGKPKASGTYAQAWSVSEFVRNAYQDYLGFRPNLLQNRLHFVPALPAQWTSLQARLPFGNGEQLQVELQRQGKQWWWRFGSTNARGREVLLDLLAADGSRRRVQFLLNQAGHVLRWDGVHAELDGKPLISVLSMASQQARIGRLQFLAPPPYLPSAFPVLKEKDVLQRQILASPAAVTAKPVRR